jgi:protein-tyrosine phosphatase
VDKREYQLSQVETFRVIDLAMVGAMPTAVVHVEVDTGPDGTLLVGWQLEGGPMAVDVACGPTPDHLDHRHQTTVVAGHVSVRLPGRPGARLFVSVAPHDGGPAVVGVDRRVPFEGITNFRDVGGYRTPSGARIRWGLVFRADSLHGMSRRDFAMYEQLGLRAVYDLRGELESQERPDPVSSRLLTITARPVDADPPPATAAGETIGDGEQFLCDMYVGLIEHAPSEIGELLTLLGRDEALPAVFHCHAGKDRTGIVAALLLEALGVGRDVVLDDYELTARYRLRTQQESSFRRLVEQGMSPDAAAGVLTTPRWAMQHALEDLERRYGGIDAYLTGPAGMLTGDLRGLRQRLLAPAG